MLNLSRYEGLVPSHIIIVRTHYNYAIEYLLNAVKSSFHLLQRGTQPGDMRSHDEQRSAGVGLFPADCRSLDFYAKSAKSTPAYPLHYEEYTRRPMVAIYH
mmetsp:Transcript_8283/g.13413  ORF Transcript_8283/g.13413 Transcript_8283/m.13413 type:complete len:101 (-) Transcript_8283:585-887(-)